MHRTLAISIAAVIGGFFLAPAQPASARSYDSWSAVSNALSGSQTPWEPRLTLGLSRDPKLGIDISPCKGKGKKGSVIRVRHASPKARRVFYIVEQPNGVPCVKTSNAGYGKVGSVRNHGFVFDIYAKCGKPTCPPSAITKRGLVQMRPAGAGASVTNFRMATKGLAYAEVTRIVEGLTLNAYN